MIVRYGDGLVMFEVADDSEVARAVRENALRAQFAENFDFVPESEREQMVKFEMDGYDAAARALTTWCECRDTTSAETYYVRANGRHGHFHDPLKGGCGGIAQVG